MEIRGGAGNDCCRVSRRGPSRTHAAKRIVRASQGNGLFDGPPFASRASIFRGRLESYGIANDRAIPAVYQTTGRLTASRFAEHLCGGAARPAKASIAPNAMPGWPGSVEDPRPSGCFAKRSGGDSCELLGGWAVPEPVE